MRPIVLSLAVLFVALGAPVRAAEPKPVAAIVADYQKASGSPGVVVAIVRRNGPVSLSGFGVASLGSTAPVTGRSLFHMASITKPFVATAVMQLVDAGRVDLDAPLVRYLPYFRLADPRYGEITVRQMLNHTSGMPDVEDYEWDKPQFDDAALEGYVRSLGSLRLVSAPGAEFHYSNIAYDTLGDLVAKVSGQTFEAYVQAHILKPAGMSDSTLLYREADLALMVAPHVLDATGAPVRSQVFPYNRIHAGSSTLYSNAADMSRWARVVLAGGAGVLAPASFAEMIRPYDVAIHHADFEPYKPRMGLGWFRLSVDGQEVIWHAGQDVGFTTNLLVAPKAGVAVVTMSNIETERSSAQLFEMSRKILRDAIARP